MTSSSATVTTVIPYSPEYTPHELLERAVNSAESQTTAIDVMVIHDKESKGPSWARNRGIERADSRYIAFLDADDIWKEDKIARQLREMRKKSAGICVQNEDVGQETFMRELYLGNIESITSSILVDTNKITETRFNETIRRREDHLYILEAASEGGVCFVENLFTVGGHKNSFASNTSTVFRLREDIRFSSFVKRSVPEITRYINNYYSAVRCDPTYPNTFGDLMRIVLMGSLPWTVPFMLLSIMCQRLKR